MKKQIIAALFTIAVSVMSVPAFAADASPTGFSTQTELNTLLENPVAAAVIEKHFPGLAKAEGISMAGSMSLRDLQQFKADLFTDKTLQETDADLAQIPVTK